MEYKKRKYYINTIHGVHLVEGIVTELKNVLIGIHKVEDVWVVDEVASGTLIRAFCTRKEAKEWIEANITFLERIPTKKSYNSMVERFEYKCEKLQ